MLPRTMTYLVVASCMALQLSGTIHLAVVQHAICAEHGEAMDVGEHSHTPLAAAGEDGIYAGTGAEPLSKSHHHCPLDEDRNTHGLVVYAAFILARVAVPEALPPPQVELAYVTPRARQLLAPKTSPPALS